MKTLRRITKRVMIGMAIAVIISLIALVFVFGSRFTRAGRESRQRINARQQEGAAFGKTTNQRGCLEEGLRRGRQLGIIDFQAQADNENFVDGCLQTSSATQGFCDGVPSVIKNMFVDWDKKQCKKSDLLVICEGIYERQVKFCDR